MLVVSRPQNAVQAFELRATTGRGLATLAAGSLLAVISADGDAADLG